MCSACYHSDVFVLYWKMIEIVSAVSALLYFFIVVDCSNLAPSLLSVGTRAYIMCVAGILQYGDVISELLEAGLNVYTMDWRSQGLSGRHLLNPQVCVCTKVLVHDTE